MAISAENQYLACPFSIAREFPEAHQALLGYDTLGALGYVDGGKHPKSILDTGPPPAQEGQHEQQEVTGAQPADWNPLVPSSAAWLPFPSWVMRGGQYEPPLFRESEVRCLLLTTSTNLQVIQCFLAVSVSCHTSV